MPTETAYDDELSVFCKTRHQSWLGGTGQRQRNGLEGKCDFPQVMKSNCCHFLGSSFGSGEPRGEIGYYLWGQERAEKMGVAVTGEKT